MSFSVEILGRTSIGGFLDKDGLLDKELVATGVTWWWWLPARGTVRSTAWIRGRITGISKVVGVAPVALAIFGWVPAIWTVGAVLDVIELVPEVRQNRYGEGTGQRRSKAGDLSCACSSPLTNRYPCGSRHCGP